MWEKVKLLKMSNFTFSHNVFYAIGILKSCNSHISVVVCSFFEFWMVSKWCIREWVNSLPNDKFSGWSKLTALADNKINVTEKLKFVLGRVEKIEGKGEDAGYQRFLHFPQCFQKASFVWSLALFQTSPGFYLSAVEVF